MANGLLACVGLEAHRNQPYPGHRRRRDIERPPAAVLVTASSVARTQSRIAGTAAAVRTERAGIAGLSTGCGARSHGGDGRVRYRAADHEIRAAAADGDQNRKQSRKRECKHRSGPHTSPVACFPAERKSAGGSAVAEHGGVTQSASSLGSCVFAPAALRAGFESPAPVGAVAARVLGAGGTSARPR